MPTPDPHTDPLVRAAIDVAAIATDALVLTFKGEGIAWASLGLFLVSRACQLHDPPSATTDAFIERTLYDWFTRACVTPTTPVSEAIPRLLRIMATQTNPATTHGLGGKETLESKPRQQGCTERAVLILADELRKPNVRAVYCCLTPTARTSFMDRVIAALKCDLSVSARTDDRIDFANGSTLTIPIELTRTGSNVSQVHNLRRRHR
jgi:hypothetical protein